MESLQCHCWSLQAPLCTLGKGKKAPLWATVTPFVGDIGPSPLTPTAQSQQPPQHPPPHLTQVWCVCVGVVCAWRALHMTRPSNTQPFILIRWKNEINTSKPTVFPATKPAHGRVCFFLMFLPLFSSLQIRMTWRLLSSCFHKQHTLAFPGSSKSFRTAGWRGVASRDRAAWMVS